MAHSKGTGLALPMPTFPRNMLKHKFNRVHLETELALRSTHKPGSNPTNSRRHSQGLHKEEGFYLFIFNFLSMDLRESEQEKLRFVVLLIYIGSCMCLTLASQVQWFPFNSKHECVGCVCEGGAYKEFYLGGRKPGCERNIFTYISG